MPVECSEKCVPMIQETEGAALINAPLLEEGSGNDDDDSLGTYGKRDESEVQKDRRKRRRGGSKSRKNKEILSCYICEKNEKRLQYSKKELEGLRYENLDYQKKKWVEVFSGLSPLVAQEYEDLLRGKKNHHKPDDAPTFDFDPRLQFLKSANLVEQVTGDYSENLEPMDVLAVEDLCSQDDEIDDSDDDYNSIQKPAFVVTGDPDFDSGPPLDGWEYLRRVRWETDRIPKVKVAKIDIIKEQSVYMPQIPDILGCPQNLLPLKEWEDNFLADFSELRQRLSESANFEATTETQSFHDKEFLAKFLESANFEATNVLVSTDDDSGLGKVVEISDEVNSSSSDLPTLSKILKMEPVGRMTMLRRRISMVEKMSIISRDDGLWLFALCAAVDCPLDGDSSAAMRSLLRKCTSIRAVKTEPDDELIILNILVTIAGRYFGQLEK